MAEADMPLERPTSPHHSRCITRPECLARRHRHGAVASVATRQTLTRRLIPRMPTRIKVTPNLAPIIRRLLPVAPTPVITPQPLPVAPTPAITSRVQPAAPTRRITSRALPAAQTRGITSRVRPAAQTCGTTSQPQVRQAVQPLELALQPRLAQCQRSPRPVASCRIPTHTALAGVLAPTERMATGGAIATALTAGDTGMGGPRESTAELSRG
jgi:hypothetical protein